MYSTEEGHRSVRKLWSFILSYFIGLKYLNYVLNLYFVDK